jgi:hypothetical protein
MDPKVIRKFYTTAKKLIACIGVARQDSLSHPPTHCAHTPNFAFEPTRPFKYKHSQTCSATRSSSKAMCGEV